MHPSLPTPSYPLITSHSSLPRSPSPLLAAHKFHSALRVAIPFIGPDITKKLEKELKGTELFYYVVICTLGDLLNEEFVSKYLAHEENKGGI